MGKDLTVFEGQLSRSLVAKFNRGKVAELNWQAERQYALNILRKNDYLTTCSPESFAIAMMDVAFTGLSLSPTLGHAYLIPYKGELQFKPSYKGLEHLVYKAGTVKSIQTALVRSKDAFLVRTVNNRRVIEHVERSGDADPIIAAYAILLYTSGGEYVEVMNGSELRAVEAQAKSVPRGGAVYNTPWKGEMYRKAVLRRALKHAPLDDGGRMAAALSVSDKYDPVDFNAPLEGEEPIEKHEDAGPVVLVSADQCLSAHAALTDGGLEPAQATTWLTKMAEAMGHSTFEDLPAAKFEEAQTRLKARLEKWRGAQA